MLALATTLALVMELLQFEYFVTVADIKMLLL